MVRTPVRLVLAGVEPVGARSVLALAPSARRTRSSACRSPRTSPRSTVCWRWRCCPRESRASRRALLEAMALGKPVIASAAGGNLDLVSHEVDGLLVPPLDPTAWAARDRRACSADAALAARLGQRRPARPRAVTFSLDRTVSRAPRSSTDRSWPTPACSGRASRVRFFPPMTERDERVVRISGFTIVRNAIKLDFPVEASIRSILPVCDEVVVNVGRSPRTRPSTWSARSPTRGSGSSRPNGT